MGSLSGCRSMSEKRSVPGIRPRNATFGRAARCIKTSRHKIEPISTPRRMPEPSTPAKAAIATKNSLRCVLHRRLSVANFTSPVRAISTIAARTVADDLWTAAKERQSRTRHVMQTAGTLASANRPKYLFSGLTKCGICGAGYVLSYGNRLACFGARDHGTCTNRLTIKRNEVEARVLAALKDKLLRLDLFEEFCEEFTREMNRLRMEHRAGRVAAERELERIQHDVRRMIQAIKDGFGDADLKVEWNATQERKAALQAQLTHEGEPLPLLHPGMSDLYREKVTRLAEALENPETRSEAAEAIRGLVDAIVLTPAEGALESFAVHRASRSTAAIATRDSGLRIELRGNLAAMLGAAQKATRSPDTGDLVVRMAMVAGARNQRYLQLWATQVA